jgi:hypothetical protein
MVEWGKFMERTVKSQRRKFLTTGFTLIEMGLVLFVSTILLIVFFQVTSFNSQYLAVRAKAFILASHFRSAVSLALQSLLFQDQRLCGAGLLFEKQPQSGGSYSYSYFVVASTTKKAVCTDPDLKDEDFNLINSSSPLIRVFRTLQLTTSTNPDINQLVLGDKLEEMTLTVRVDNSQLNFNKLLLLFRSPYADKPLLFTDTGLVGGWQNLDFELSLKNEKATVRISFTGQIMLR